MVRGRLHRDCPRKYLGELDKQMCTCKSGRVARDLVEYMFEHAEVLLDTGAGASEEAIARSSNRNLSLWEATAHVRLREDGGMHTVPESA